MTDTISHESAETALNTLRRTVIDKLPDCDDRTDAGKHIEDAEASIHRAIEGAESRPEPATATATVTGDW